MAIQFSPTPNPNAGKFAVAGGLPDPERRSFSSAAAASDHPIGRALFAIPGVASVFMVGDFVTVTKADEADWSELIDRIIAALEEALS
jgi:hypothetical protein